jgi:hypothetical protein
MGSESSLHHEQSIWTFRSQTTSAGYHNSHYHSPDSAYIIKCSGEPLLCEDITESYFYSEEWFCVIPTVNTSGKQFTTKACRSQFTSQTRGPRSESSQAEGERCPYFTFACALYSSRLGCGVYNPSIPSVGPSTCTHNPYD